MQNGSSKVRPTPEPGTEPEELSTSAAGDGVYDDIPCSKLHWNCIERPLNNLLYRHALVVARYPWPFVLIPFIVTAIFAPGIALIDQEYDPETLFTPQHSQAQYEKRVIKEHWPSMDGVYHPSRSISDFRQAMITATVKNQSDSILDDPYVSQVWELNSYIANTLAIYVKGVKYTYRDLCLRDPDLQCYDNVIIKYINDKYFFNKYSITYPNIIFGERKVYYGSVLSGVLVRNDSTDIVVSAKSWMMIYQLRHETPEDLELSRLWELEFEVALRNWRAANLSLTYFHGQTLTWELARNAESFVPKFVLAFILIITFCILGSSVLFRLPTSPFICVDWVLSKGTVAAFAALICGCGCLTSLGIMGYAGITYNNIALVMPFLLVAIGVDNMFLLVGAFKRTDPTLPVDRRLASAVSQIAVSITVTSLTDAVSLAVGIITDLMAVRIFCTATSIAIVVTYCFQLTGLVGIMALYGRLEAAGRHCVLGVKAISINEWKSVSLFKHLWLMGTTPDTARISSRRSVSGHFFYEAGLILMTPVVKAIAMFWLAVYLAIAIYGCISMREGLEPVKLLVSDSYAIPHYRIMEKLYWKYGTELQIVVSNPPDLVYQRNESYRIAEAFMNKPQTLGYEGLSLWVETFDEYLRTSNDYPQGVNETNFYQVLWEWSHAPRYNHWLTDIAFTASDVIDGEYPKVKAFRFTLGMKNFGTPAIQRVFIFQARSIAASMPQYNVTTYWVFNPFVDQYNIILPTTLSNIAIALASIIVISLLFIPHPFVSFWVAIAVISIDIGVIGFMTLWDVRLDCLSMITIIMSVGFSVDFSAHVAYHFSVSKEADYNKRAAKVLRDVGWPILEGAISTILGVIVLMFSDSYMMLAFVKTVILVMVFGITHGLIFLPVVLTLFYQLMERCKCHI